MAEQEPSQEVTQEETVEMIRQMRGTDIDPTVADALLAVVRQRAEAPASEPAPQVEES